MPTPTTESAAETTTVFDDPTNFNVKHPLGSRWTLWFDRLDKKATQRNWDENLRNLITFDTVEDFWAVYNNVIKASELAQGSNYHLFKEGVRPAWEDPANQEGGKWVIPIAKSKRGNLDTYWLNTVLACIGEALDDDNDVCGIVMSCKKQADRISLWTATANNKDVTERIGRQLKAAVGLPETEQIQFQAHKDAAARNSSYSNKALYTV
ncbi:hypothetical protein HK102_001250 [Quaeritorhiza haematococci]|nr:hypothetical protein HK102_001250 [Quaeritorhiza haematococci]